VSTKKGGTMRGRYNPLNDLETTAKIETIATDALRDMVDHLEYDNGTDEILLLRIRACVYDALAQVYEVIDDYKIQVEDATMPPIEDSLRQRIDEIVKGDK
jgi:hypothetical protein